MYSLIPLVSCLGMLRWPLLDGGQAQGGYGADQGGGYGSGGGAGGGGGGNQCQSSTLIMHASSILIVFDYLRWIRREQPRLCRRWRQPRELWRWWRWM